MKNSPKHTSKYGCSVSFVGASLIDQGQHYRTVFLTSYAQWSGKDDGVHKLEKMMNQQSKDWSTFLIPELLVEFFPKFSVAMADAHVSLSSLLGEWTASLKRREYVQALHHFQPNVWGDRQWSSFPNYRGQAGHLHEVVHIYRNSEISVDINRIYQPDIVTMRVFDVIASGGFILTEHSPALESLFEVGTEVATYRTLEDLVEKVDYYLNHPEKRRAIVEAGRERVQKEHTMKHRIDRMLLGIQEK